MDISNIKLKPQGVFGMSFLKKNSNLKWLLPILILTAAIVIVAPSKFPQLYSSIVQRSIEPLIRVTELFVTEPQKQYEIGNRYRFQSPPDYYNALKWYRKAAEKNYPEAMNSLGVLYENGNGVEQDYKIALSWYQKAAEQGNLDAYSNIAAKYLKGLGVDINYEKAFHFYKLAADQGHSESQRALGILYKEGRGVEKDYLEAGRWYKLAADNGLKEAQDYLQKVYSFCPSNRKISLQDFTQDQFEFCLIGAGASHPPALQYAGQFYYWGRFVKRDTAKAIELTKSAVDLGYEEALPDLKIMTTEETLKEMNEDRKGEE